MSHIGIKIVEPGNADLMHLISKLDKELLGRYPAEEVHGINFDDPNIHKTVFVVAYVNGNAAGCGAIRPLDDTSTELKRFFVEPGYRRIGIASRVLSFLEERAIALRFDTVKLETGTEQPEAISFYKKHGYTEIEKFGEYTGCEMSLCYEKRIV